MPFTRVKDLNVYSELRGAGPRLLYISGTGGDLRWRPNAFDHPVAAEFTVLAYDQRGLGQTDRPNGPYAMADYANDAAGLLDAVGWDSCTVMGVSFGGMVAQELAIRFPRRVQRLVLACSSSGGAGGASFPLHQDIGLDPLERARRSISRSDTRRDAAWQATHPEEAKALIDQAIARARVGAGEPGRELGARLQLEARSVHNTFNRLPSLTMPVLVCGGKYDGIAPGENQLAIARQVPHARLELFDGGHTFLDQDPAAFQRIIAFLLRRARPTKGGDTVTAAKKSAEIAGSRVTVAQRRAAIALARGEGKSLTGWVRSLILDALAQERVRKGGEA